MKLKITLSIGIFAFCSTYVSAQKDQLSKDFEPIRTELVSWDSIRGKWLANSMLAVMNNEAIPDRTFPEDLTPHEMLKVLPNSRYEYLEDQLKKQQIARNQTNTNSAEWDRLNRFFQSRTCKPTTARSYGDPHLSSFDKASFSFQTVGEFVMTKSNSGHLEVQARQKPQSDNFSLNTAVAMNVAGDRVAIYAEDAPISFQRSPIYINGTVVDFTGTYYLNHGGVIRNTGDNYLIVWPSGESVNAEIRSSGRMRFMNLTVSIMPCLAEYSGVLGNANGNSQDDFNTTNASTPRMMAFSTFGDESLERGSTYAEKQFLAFIAKSFAADWRVNDFNTLFDYSMGRTTASFTDLSFPRVHMTVDDLNPTQRENARRICAERGVSNDEMRGCVYDQAFISLPPNPAPVIPDRTRDFKATPITREIPNINRTPQPMPIKPADKLEETRPSIHPDLLKGEETVKPRKDTDIIRETKPQTISTNPEVKENPSTINNGGSVEPKKNPGSTVPVTKTPDVIVPKTPKPASVVKPVETQPKVSPSKTPSTPTKIPSTPTKTPSTPTKVPTSKGTLNRGF